MNFGYKTASKKELKEKWKEIAKKVGDSKFFTKKELNYLPKILSEDEDVIAFTSGFMDKHTWLIVLTNKRIVFLDKGMFFGLEQIAIDLDRITSVSGKTGLFFGEILIEDGVKERYIKNVLKKTVRPFTNLVNEEIQKYRQKLYHQQSNKTSTEDPYAKLEKLMTLKEKGTISEEEFNEAKRKILENIS